MSTFRFLKISQNMHKHKVLRSKPSLLTLSIFQLEILSEKLDAKHSLISQRNISISRIWGCCFFKVDFLTLVSDHINCTIYKAGNWLCLYNTLFPGYSIQVKLESNKPPCTCSFSFQVSHLALFIAFTATSGQGHWTLAWEKNATFSRLISYRTSNRSM